VTSKVKEIGKDNGLSLNLIPNPMSDKANIEIVSNRTLYADLQIVNSYGVVIKSINNILINEGKLNINWDGCDMNGTLVPDGIYIIKLSCEYGVIVDKVIILR
jgi:flagellar hook assembly protein FlgD